MCGQELFQNCVDNILIEKVAGNKDLGILFDHKLDFVRPIDIVIPKAYSMISLSVCVYVSIISI